MAADGTMVEKKKQMKRFEVMANPVQTLSKTTLSEGILPTRSIIIVVNRQDDVLLCRL